MDVVVTVPKRLWRDWLTEGDLADADAARVPAAWAGHRVYGFTMGGGCVRPAIVPGDRVYVVAHGWLRGWAPFVGFDDGERFGGRPGSWAFVRHGDAVACTINEPIRGFQGWRKRWWDRDVEVPFAKWRTAGVLEQTALL